MKNTSKITLVITNEKKLGDSIVAYTAAHNYSVFNNSDMILLSRYNYSLIAKRYNSFKTISYKGKYDLFIICLYFKLFSKKIETIANISGETKQIKKILKLFNTHQTVSRVRDYAFSNNGDQLNFNHLSNFEYTWGPFNLLNHNFNIPQSVFIPHICTQNKNIIISPLSVEKRRNIPPEDTMILFDYYSKKYPNLTIKILLNKKSKYLEEYKYAGWRNIIYSSNIKNLMHKIENSKHIVSCDTGTYVLAAALDIQCDIFFSSSQPNKASYSTNNKLTKYRAAELQNEHCNIFNCNRAECITLEISRLVGKQKKIQELNTPPGCPLLSQPSYTEC